ncbi:hypothetical protein GCM10022281_14980 [Sphingomonas rosea]|uniref:Ti-type conjugative transfer relaxase TraA n=1 Tax=Sphingomonas rosea TaxID=335605 RepID=A0ABP7U480_9SPHN
MESVGSAHMAVLLDDGRAIAFDLKNYAQVDHGYAATIHKAQGVTVDRTYVLATQGLDRHAAYVALSRHREAVQLHYGEDDFASRDKLVSTLSRDRAKDMASDYTRDFADRRSIILPAVSVPAKQLDMFEGLTPARRPERQPTDCQRRLHDSVVRVAKAVDGIVRARKSGGLETPKQAAELRAAAAELNQQRPNGARDLRAAFVRDMGMLADATEGRTAGAIRSMDFERRYWTDPQLRADHFVRSWRQLGDRHEWFERRGDESAAGRVRAQMTALAKTLERDPQLESLLRTRGKELGLPAHIDRPLSQTLPDWIGWGRGRGMER